MFNSLPRIESSIKIVCQVLTCRIRPKTRLTERHSMRRQFFEYLSILELNVQNVIH